MVRSAVLLILGLSLLPGCGGPSDTVTEEKAPVNQVGTPETDAVQKEAQDQK